MSEIDDRVVFMQFDNNEFERKLSETLKSLALLTETMKFPGASQGFDQMAASADKVDLSGMAKSVENIGSKFSIMGATAFSVIQNLTTGALDFIKKIGGDVLGPILSGGRNRAENIEQAKFMFRGLGVDVEKGMESALAAVKGTAYGLDSAAKAAAQFSASGIKVGEDMTGALRGIAGAAAMTGTSFEEISGIFTSAAGAGKVSNQEFNQFAVRGLNAASAVGKVIGKTEAEVHQMATNGDLDFKTFASAMDKAFGSHATQANETFSGSLANVRAAMSRLGAAFFTPVLEQQRDLFNVLAPTIDNAAKALQPFIDGLVKISGIGIEETIKFLKGLKFDGLKTDITVLSKGMVDLFHAVKMVAGIIGSAFQQIFPAGAANSVSSIVSLFAQLAEWLEPLPKTADQLKRSFAGVFAIFDIVFNVVKELAFAVGNLVGHFRGTAGGALEMSAKLGDLLVRLDDFLVKGGALHRFFLNIDHVVDNFVATVKTLDDKIAALFNRIGDTKVPEVGLTRVQQRFEGLRKVLDGLESLYDDIKRILGAALDYVVDWFSKLGRAIAATLKPGDFDAAVDTMNLGLLGGIVLMLRRFLDGSSKLNVNVGAGVFTKLKLSLDNLTLTFKAMQAELQAKALLEIGIAIGIIAASIAVLSLIDSASLTKALSAMSVGFGQLVGVMAILSKMSSTFRGALTLDAMAGAMILMATSVTILAGAVAIFGNLGADTLAKGLGALAIGLSLMVGAIDALKGDTVGALAASVAMVAIATAMTILGGALAIFGNMSWGEIAKGMVGLTGVLVILDAAISEMPIPSMLAAGLAMIPLATGITILGGAVKLFATLSWGEMLKGLVGVLAVLAIISVAMEGMPPTLPITAAGLILVGIALGLMAEAVKLMGNMDFGTMIKGLAGIGALLLILAIGVNAMSGAIGGALALIVVAGALSVLSGVLKNLATLSWGDLVKGLVAIAAVMVVLGLSAAIMQPIIPALLSLGIALTLVGLGFTLFGIGAYLVAKAFIALAEAGVVGTKALIESLKLILEAIPRFVAALVVSLLHSSADILNSAQLLLKILTVFLLQVLDTVIQLAPKIAEALVAIITAALVLIRAKFPDVMQTFIDLLVTATRTLADNAYRIVDAGTDLVVNFARAISAKADDLVNSAIDLIMAFIGAVGARANDITGAGTWLLLTFLAGMINNIYRITDFAVTVIITFVQTLANEWLRLVRAGTDILVTLARALSENAYRAAAAGVDTVIAFLEAMGNQAIRLARGAADVLIMFLNGMADAIREKAPEIRRAGANIADAIIDGITGGLSNRAKDVAKSTVDVAKDAFNAAKDWLLSRSPSRRFMELGESMADGISVALDSDTGAENSAVAHAERIVAAFAETLSRIPDSLEGLDASPVITPVLDLTKVEQAAAGLSSLLPNPTLTPDVSYSQARNLAATANTGATATDTAEQGPTEIKFEQNNYSPESLSTTDIYRATKSQLAQAKEELKI